MSGKVKTVQVQESDTDRKMKGNGGSSAFSEANFGKKLASWMELIQKLDDEQWEQIMDLVMERVDQDIAANSLFENAIAQMVKANTIDPRTVIEI